MASDEPPAPAGSLGWLTTKLFGSPTASPRVTTVGSTTSSPKGAAESTGWLSSLIASPKTPRRSLGRDVLQQLQPQQHEPARSHSPAAGNGNGNGKHTAHDDGEDVDLDGGAFSHIMNGGRGSDIHVLGSATGRVGRGNGVPDSDDREELEDGDEEDDDVDDGEEEEEADVRLALYSYDARGPDEITVRKGDAIIITQPVPRNGYICGFLDGRVGRFPADCV
eukprot:m.107125 g.107125  ORF g.107125 m.107125 type:complete len:222 (-) comp15830_c2_seq2:286-951(-)